MNLAVLIWTLFLSPSQAPAPPERSHEIACAREDGPGPQTIVLRYDIEVIEIVDNDVHGTIVGEWEQSDGTSGSLDGGITPRIWYGGGFDVAMGDVRLLILREWDPTRAFVWYEPESSTYTCSGTLPD